MPFPLIDLLFTAILLIALSMNKDEEKFQGIAADTTHALIQITSLFSHAQLLHHHKQRNTTKKFRASDDTTVHHILRMFPAVNQRT
jgi:hypothetical protein